MTAPTDHDRLLRVEEATRHILESLERDRRSAEAFRADVRARMAATDARILGFALSVALSGVGVALTVVLTR